jgi:uncharacterized protein (DUF1697 family)
VARTRYLALLRGINVGGRNPVPMADLRAALEDAGYTEVSTYIQSGNVLLTSSIPRAALERDIETVIERRFGFPAPVLVRSRTQLRAIVEQAPSGFGERPDTHHSDVVFLKAPLTARQALTAVAPREGVDEAWPGRGVLYFQRLSARLARSRLSRVTATREYQLMTIRTWTTTTKLLALLDA